LSHRIDLQNDEWYVGLAEISFPPISPTRKVREERDDDGSLEEASENTPVVIDNPTPTSRVAVDIPPKDNRTRTEEGLVRGDEEVINVKLQDGSYFTIPIGTYNSIAAAFARPFVSSSSQEKTFISNETIRYIEKLSVRINQSGVDERLYPRSLQILANGVKYSLLPGTYDSLTELFNKSLSGFSGARKEKIKNDLSLLSAVLIKLFNEDSTVTDDKIGETIDKARAEMNAGGGTRKREKRSISSPSANIYVYTDIIKPQLVGDTLSRCIRILNINIGEYQTFNPIYYFPVEKNNIESVEILLADKLGEPISFHSGEQSSIVVLHFIKKN
jgi:hypothetical protein